MISRAYYSSSAREFLKTDSKSILGRLTANHHFALDIKQRNAWLEQISNLKEQLEQLPGGELFLEFAIPRMGKRVDAVILLSQIVFVIEYKTGQADHTR